LHVRVELVGYVSRQKTEVTIRQWDNWPREQNLAVLLTAFEGSR